MLKILPWAPMTIKIQILLCQTRAVMIKPHTPNSISHWIWTVLLKEVTI